jgi:epoxyqueuosine reductase QueG
MKPRLMNMIEALKKKDVEAEPVGFWGYPRGEVMQLKHMAIMAGLGQQGKNTLFLEPIFGLRLRLAALKTNAQLTPTGPGTYDLKENPLCQSCTACIDACPVDGLFQPYRLLDPARCLCNVKNVVYRDGIAELPCKEVCRTVCPIGE